MNKEMSRHSVISSLIWKLLERGGTQGVQFIVSIILARLLIPEQYGIIALVTVFISLARVFVQSGFNTALIQKKDADEVDFSSVFYLSLGIAGILYTVIFFSAPFISTFYEQPLLVPVLRVLSLTLFIGAFNSIQNAYIARNMLFKKLFISSLVGVIVSGIIGVITAYNDWGVWALVAQQLTNQLIIAAILFFTVKWRPCLSFSFQKVERLFSYGSNLLASSLIDTLYREMRTLVVGRIFSPIMLGYYNRGQQFPSLIVSNIDGSIQSVMLPTLSAIQENRIRMKELMRRSIVTSSFLIFPLMIGMAVVAEPIVIVVLTERWLPAVPFLQIFCFSFAFWPIHTANLQAINAIGRSDIYFKLEIVKKTLGIIILVGSLPFGVYAIAIGEVLSGILATFINAFPNKKLFDYSYMEQLKDIMPSLIISIIMGIIVYLFKYLSVSVLNLLFLQVFCGIVTYLLLAKLFKLDSLSYLFSILNQLLRAKK